MIRKAEFHDLHKVATIFDNIILHEEQNTKYTAFQANVYPTSATAKKALQENSLYVYEMDGELCACIILNQTQPDEYKNISWKFGTLVQEVLVVHLLCVRPDKAGLGLGRQMVAFAIEQGKKRNCKTIRLDTGSQNLPARHLYEKIGFTIAGTNNMSIGGLIPHDNHLFYEMNLLL